MVNIAHHFPDSVSLWGMSSRSPRLKRAFYLRDCILLSLQRRVAYPVLAALITLGAALLIGLSLTAAVASAFLAALITVVVLGVQSYQRHSDDVITRTPITG